MHTAVLLYCLIAILAPPSHSARILGVIPTPSYSHQVAFQPLWRELSLRGHQVTVLTTDPINDPELTNLTEIDLHSSYKVWNDNIEKMISNTRKNALETINVLISTANAFMDQELQHPQVRALIKNDTESFDLLMVEVTSPAMVAFSARFKCPFIGIASLDPLPMAYSRIGNPAHPVLNPDGNLPFVGELTFWQRLISALFNGFSGFYYKKYVMPLQQSLISKHFGDDYPNIKDIYENMSMLFVNANPVFNQIRPLVPAVIQVGGGSRLRTSKAFPKGLQALLDDARQGFIYFSLGTNVKSKNLSNATQSVILETFAELPYLVLWKFELEDLKTKPDNVFVSKWFPQQDIFKHPNIKLFITQGGQQSIEEAVHDNVPIVGMPFAGDQPANIKRLVAKGLGLSVDYESLNKGVFKSTILEVINNPKYIERVKELSNVVKDQPMTGLEKAVWWTEYVLRHKGAKHLRSPMIDIPLYQYLLLDVIGFCVLVVVILSYTMIRLVKLLHTLINSYVTPKQKVKVN